MKKNYSNTLLVFISILFAAYSSVAKENDKDSTKKEKKVSVFGLALPAKSPENGFYVNGGIIGVFKTNRTDTTLRLSNLYLYGLYSQLNQCRVSIGGDIFTKKEKYYLNGWYYYSYLPELYFGTGNNVSPEKSEFINYQLWYLNTNVLRNIYKKWFGGFVYTYEHLYKLNYIKDGIADSHKPTGLENYNLSAPGLRIRHDSRDNILSSRNGNYLDVFYTISKPGIGSDFIFDQFSLDARKFVNLTPKKYNILAFNFILKHSGGNVPFRYLSNITARGYHPNIFRDNSLISLQAEYRFAIIKWFGASLFGGASEVSNSFATMNLKYIKENYGGGFRFRIFKKNNMYLRLEYGRSSNTSNFYLAFEDAF